MQTKTKTRKQNERNTTISLTVENLEDLIAEQNIQLIEEPLPANLLGYYDHTTRTIHIDNTLSYTQRRCTLCHELWHATLKHQHTTNNYYNHKDEQQTRRLTAQLLINDTEYALAEQLYEGNTTAIAHELQVTRQVIKDYQHILASKF